jgi:hypothetical protein
MAIQAPFGKKVAGSQNSDDCFLALLGNDRELDLAVLNVKNRVGDLSLLENNLILPIVGYRFSLAHLGEKYFGIKRGFGSLPHKGFPFLLARAALSPDEGRARRGNYSGFHCANKDPACPYCSERGRELGKRTPDEIVVLVQHLVMLQALHECGR